MYEKEDLSPGEIKERATKLGLEPSAADEQVFILNIEGKSENDIQTETVELERRGFKKVDKEEINTQQIEFTYDASLAAPRG